MLNSLNLNATFGLVKIQEEYLASAKKLTKLAAKKSDFSSGVALF